MKIVILIHSMSGGGAERVLANLANEWVRRDWEVTIITFAPQVQDFYELNPSISRIALNLAEESHNLIQGISANLFRILAVRREVIRLSPDIVLGFMHVASITAILACMKLNIPVIGTEHNHPPMQPQSFFWNQVRKWVYPFAKKIVMLTHDGADWLNSTIPKARAEVIPNPVIYPLVAFEPKLAVESVIGMNRKVLLAVGRLNEGKGFDYLLLAFSRLAKKHPDWDLIILGEGPVMQSLILQIQQLELESRVYLPGRVGNVGDWYQRADLYVMSSLFEGLPNTLLEAMAYGCAAVSYDCDTGPRDIIRHEDNGLLVKPVGDVSALTSALDRLMQDDETRHRMGQRATTVRDDFSLKSIMIKWDKLFEESIL
ncbi:MAG: glycosyltransferase family 4 protein [Nitrosomonas sp.]